MDERKPIAAGMFYPSSKEKLSSQLSSLFSQAGASEKYRIVVSPHAGYVYSGLGAACAIGSLKPADTFIVLGPNHTGLGEKFSIMSQGVWKTPLGDVEIDMMTALALKRSGVLEEDDWAHASEHSIEVQLPFLQHKFGKLTFVPVCIMNTDYSQDFLNKCGRLGELIGLLMKEKSIGLVASSDFSHYVPAKSAEKYDKQAIERISSLDVKGFFETLKRNRATVCGYGPIAVAMSAARSLSLKQGELIKYTNSGDVTKDYSSVVAYAAIGFL
ncbi:MAG: AmmeMemoRadiSam system protein B [Candidatus Aenigmarchaeota archaeon]|nr:AmmeMemoRadiSam system protein B [Candidatus Aenigmarchaeota archaeon]